MWLPAPIYEKIPHFWFFAGIFLIAMGLYLGYAFTQTMFYLGMGASCCLIGAGVFVLRMRHRRSESSNESTEAKD